MSNNTTGKASKTSDKVKEPKSGTGKSSFSKAGKQASARRKKEPEKRDGSYVGTNWTSFKG